MQGVQQRLHAWTGAARQAVPGLPVAQAVLRDHLPCVQGHHRVRESAERGKSASERSGVGNICWLGVSWSSQRNNTGKRRTERCEA